MKLLLISLLGFLAVSANFVAVFDSTNVTLQNLNSFTFRQLTVVDVSIPNFYNALEITSVAVSKNFTAATANVVHGSAYAGFQNPPSAYLAYFTDNAKWNGGNGNPTNVDMTLSDGFVGVVYTKLDEVNANGTVVQTINLANLAWSVTNHNLQGNLVSWTVTGVLNKASNFSVNVTFVMSTVVGKLAVAGSPIITPKSLEMVIEFVNFPYLNKLDHVVLGMITGGAQASVVVAAGVTHFVAGNGTSATFVTLQNVALVDGVTVPVVITNWTQNVRQQDMNNNNMGNQVQGRYGASAEFRAVAVAFPAGATTVLYDPTSGVGSTPPEPMGTTPTPGTPGTPTPGTPGYGGAASSLAPLFAFAFALALLFLM